jgi:hypothetical protein
LLKGAAAFAFYRLRRVKKEKETIRLGNQNKEKKS